MYLVDVYECLLLEIMCGIQVLFVCCDEVEEVWKWVDFIIEVWVMDNDVLKLYQVGIWGFVVLVVMIICDGCFWNEFE